MILKNKLKKEHLLLKREQLTASEDTKAFLQEIAGNEEFSTIEPMHCLVVASKLSSKGAASRTDFLHRQAKKIELNNNLQPIIKKLGQCVESFLSNEVIVFPDDWYKTGAIIIDGALLCSELNKIMYFYDDDLAVISDDYNDILFIRGDRSRDNLYNLEIISNNPLVLDDISQLR